MTKSANDEEFRVLRTGTCPSLSGRSKLTYEIACGSDNALHVRIAKNSGNGFFHEGWVAWERVQTLLDKNASKPITCHTLTPLFKGLSVNTPGFLLAALKQEGLVEPSEEYARCYQRADPAQFFRDMKALLTSTKETKPAERAKPKAVKAVKPPAKPAAKPPGANTPPKRAVSK